MCIYLFGDTMRCYLEINLQQLKNNYTILTKILKKPIMCVIKSNAYGHGLIEVAKTLIKEGASCFVVATMDEALELRKISKDIEILLLEPDTQFDILFENNITLSIGSINYLIDCVNSSFSLKIHLKLETGLNRLGILENQIDDVIRLINNSSLKLEGIYTHLSDQKTYQDQLKLFKKLISNFPRNLKIHINSSNYLYCDEISTHYRIGLALFGLLENNLNLKPLIRLKAPIYRIKKIYPEELIGYHPKEIINEEGYIYTIPLGYGDGWIKKRQTIAHKNETIFIQKGETCMDLMMLFSKTKIKETEDIIIFNENNILNLPKLYDESIYQIVTLLSHRIKRIYKKSHLEDVI